MMYLVVTSRVLEVWTSWPSRALDMNPCNSLLWGYIKNCVCCSNLHNVQEMQTDTEAVAEEKTGDVLPDKFDKFVVHLQ